MASKTDKSLGPGDIELLQTPSLPMTPDAILQDFTHYFGRMLGRRTIRTESPYLYQAVVFTARDRIMERWGASEVVVAPAVKKSRMCARIAASEIASSSNSP
jgi:hypothetical protein